ncbi:hypothetical protein KSP40_PGU015067 [Platanthera guangdongensis]|uniref:Uncharacterized protein n=1 Tax=Platanthera guangdongensis TaxID=2320717 RepID=A0ABR2MNK7_9ASPA
MDYDLTSDEEREINKTTRRASTFTNFLPVTAKSEGMDDLVGRSDYEQGEEDITNPKFVNPSSSSPNLLQVEKRLASEKESIPIATPSSPLYLSSSKPQPAPFPLDESSEPPSEFLSVPPSPEPDPVLPRSAKKRSYDNQAKDGKEEGADDDDDDDINRLINLLGLSTDGKEGEGMSSCHCSGGGFYRNAAGLKGPMCARELDRLDGWIEHYRREGRELTRLPHLLLAKAVSAEAGGVGDDDGLWGIGFPPTVNDFLEHDPPLEKRANNF